MGSVSKERLFGATIEAAEQRAREARKVAAACEAEYSHERLWRPGAAIAIARRRAQRRHRYLEVRCNGCGTHNTVDLTIIRRPRETPMQLEHRMRCKPCSEQRGYPYKRGHLVRLRRSKVTTKDDGEPRYPGDQRDRN